MLKIPPVVGKINRVEKVHYDRIISSYVEKVQKLPGVLSIIGMGSVTVPGLSDIDMIVVVDDLNPPKWGDISLIELSRGKEGAEVIFHDIFVIPQNIADFVEGFFYLDRSIVYYGNQIGGKLNQHQIDNFRKIITFDYCVHRIDSLFGLLSMAEIELRAVLLFISTFRHTYNLLMYLQVIDSAEANKKIEEIENLRINALNQEEITGDIQLKLNEGLELLFKSLIQLSIDFGYNGTNQNYWVLGSKKIIIPTNLANLKSTYFFSLKLSRYLPNVLYPPVIYEHVQLYKHFLSFKNSTIKSFNGSSMNELMEFRTSLVREHWKFIQKSGYNRSSGKGYIIQPQPSKKSIRGVVKFSVLTVSSWFLNMIRIDLNKEK